MMFDSPSFQAFLAVAVTGSFTKAAIRISRTQSAVSQQILKLENLLGNPLFKRGKTLTLTAEGEIFLSYAQRIFSLYQEATHKIQKHTLTGEIRFGVPEDFAHFFLSEILAEFSRVYPLVLLNVECDFTSNLLDRFETGDFDMVLVKVGSSEELPNSIEIFREQLEWVAQKSLIDSLKKEEPLPLVLSHHPCVYRARAIETLDNAQIKWRIVYTSSSYLGTLAAVKAGMGLTVLPRNMIPKNLFFAQKSFLPDLQNIHCCFLKKLSSSPSLNTFEEITLKNTRLVQT
jgi:DNA-binding transcriptional LysR family regulator